MAGDRPPTAAEKDRLLALMKSRGNTFYSDLLYSLTHLYFPPELARTLWAKVLRHKSTLTTNLKRNAGIAVAALDYLTNITATMSAATLVRESDFAAIVGLSLHDGLTGLFNHTYFYQQMDVEVRRFTRYGMAVSLVLFDVDNFKQVNDTLGHPEGDRVLARLGKALRSAARDTDICCRYGGEEFAAILPFTNATEATFIADRLRVAMGATAPDGPASVTVSAGVASCGRQTATANGLVKAADAALYQAKTTGKNRVVAGRQ